VDLQSDTIRLYDPTANDYEGGIVDYIQSWNGKAGSSGSSYESVVTPWESGDVLPGNRTLTYKYIQEVRWALDCLGNLWFPYLIIYSQYGWNAETSAYDELVYEKLEAYFYDQTEYWYLQPRCYMHITNVSGAIWEFESDTNIAPNHKKQVMKSIHESPYIPCSVEKTTKRYLSQDEADYVNAQYERKELEGNLIFELYRRWAWLWTPTSALYENMPSSYEVDIRKMGIDEQITSGTTRFALCEYKDRSYQQGNAKYYSTDTKGLYFNEFGKMSGDHSHSGVIPGKVERVISRRRSMKLESVYGETGSYVMSGPADKICNGNLVDIDDCDLLRAYRQMLAESTGNVWYQFQLAGEFYVERGWGFNLMPVYGLGGNSISVPTTQGSAWVEGVQISRDARTGEATTIIKVEANLA
jgi:hypothetical protein